MGFQVASGYEVREPVFGVDDFPEPIKVVTG